MANLRVRAVSIWAHDTTPSLRERLLADLPAWYRAVATEPSTSTAQDETFEQEPALVHAWWPGHE